MNAYTDLTTANAYFADRNITAWADATDEEKSAALIRATDYIDATYIFRSVKLTDEQELQNPRYGETELNPAIIKATLELALIALTTDLFTVTRDVISEETSVGSVSTSVTYSKPVTDPYPMITRLLADISVLRSASASSTRLTKIW